MTTHPCSIQARASLTWASEVLPALNHSVMLSAIASATSLGSGWRTTVPPFAPRVDSTSRWAARILIVSRIVPRLTWYSAARSASEGRR